MDPYAITLAERTRFEQQFASLKPVNGIVTGDQAKGFFLQSQLPPIVLGVIWGLADTDADGKMNIDEFSIACKLINLKLRGFEIPKVLPPVLQALVSPVGGPPAMMTGAVKPPLPPLPAQPLIPGIPPMAAPLGGVPPAVVGIPPPRPAPVAAVGPISRVISPPSGGASPHVLSPPSGGGTPMPLVTSPPQMIPTQPIVTAQPMVSAQPMVGVQPVGVQPIIGAQPMVGGQPIISAQPMVGAQPLVGAQPMVAAQPLVGAQPMVAAQPLVSAQPMVVTQPLVGAQPMVGAQPIVSTQPLMTGQPMAPAVPPSTLVGLTQAQPSAPTPVPPALAERVPSLESPIPSASPLIEWAVPQASKLKYTQLFNMTDKARTGFLSAVQARNILIASQLPQKTLAQIWTLSDMDSDGRLSCEEFVLALHLCDMARSGETIPQTLPPNLVPPTLRRQRNNSLTASDQGDPLAGISSVTFEDKRKENFEKGQAELERRRKALLETQRKEQEERERKEREEREKQEKIRLEQERKRQEEFERQVERQRELEKAKEEERKRAQEQREAARREMERQRQIEWEKQRSQELQAQRQKQQEQVLNIKAKNQALTIELSQLNEKVKELSRQISETRCGVTGVKTTIDGMRGTRDEQMSELNRLKGVLKQQNQRLVAMSQQKAKLEAQGRLSKDSDEQTRLAFNNKQITIKNLKEKVVDLEQQVKLKMSDVENNNSQLDILREELTAIITECEELYPNYDLKRKKVYELKGGRHQDSWGDSAWDTAPSWSEETATPDIPGYNKYRALYEFVARNADELSFQPGDIIMVPTAQNAEPGWLSGELRGATGWFPESYVEPLDASIDTTMQNNVQPKTQLEGIAEVAETISESDFALDEGPALPLGPEPILGLGQPVDMTASALYSFTARKSSQLSFSKGDSFKVSELQDQWCYGEMLGSEGWLPKAYVSLADAAVVPAVSPAVQAVEGSFPQEQQEYYVAMYPYQSEEVGDLTFDQGETILVVAKEGDWWTGVIGTRSGIFPSNYVQKVDSQVVEAPAAAVTPTPVSAPVVEEPVVQQTATSVAATLEPQLTGGSGKTAAAGRSVTPDFSSLASSQMESGSGEESDSKGGSTKVKKPEIATVIAPYQATSNEQLSLQRGQLIMIRKKTTTGWWEGELQAKGRKRQIGWFPASYVKLLGGGGPKASQSSARTSETATPVESTGERVIALYQYVAQNEDEISFDKDDIIVVVSKDEPSWWKGEFNGVTGLFPSNYVGPLSNNYKVTKVKLSKDERKRQHCIKELISTEQAYIDDMSIVYDVFEKPLIESRVLTKEQIRAIFINWRDIIECNYTFLRALRVRRDMSEGGVIRTIGDIICENIPRMTVYVRFCSCQLSAATLLQSLTEENKDFRSLTKRCQSDPRTQGLPLSSFLIKPMQRITKYPLFIQKILEHTPVGHPDRQYLEEAISKAEELCSQVNEGVREKENSERLEWLQSHVLSDGLTEPLIFNSLTNAMGPRKFIHFGVLWKTKSGKELVGFLMNDFLLLAQPNRPLGHQFSFERHQHILLRIYKQPLLLNETVILNTPEGNDSVELRLEYNKTIYNLSAATQNERNMWIKKLNEVQNQLKENELAKLRRQESKQASFGACGRILVVVLEGSKLKPATSVRGRRPKATLGLVIIRGSHLAQGKSRGVKREVVCEVSMGSQEQRTPAVVTPPNQEPRWNTSMQFLVKDLKEDVLCVTVRDKGHFSPDEFLGRTEVRVSEIYEATKSSPGPITKVLKLHEVRTGQVTLRLGLQLFSPAS